MDNSIRGEQDSNTEEPNNFLVSSLMFFDRLEKWLAGFFQMTQEEQKDAGISYPDDQRDT
ncbi:MAG: hypothetical protein WBW94_04320 [Anaerolineales bacterium]|jgi:hypothetical protein